MDDPCVIFFVGHALTFVFDNNLYFQENPFMTPIQVTDTGLPGTIFNGVPDWVYEGKATLSILFGQGALPTVFFSLSEEKDKKKEYYFWPQQKKKC